MSVRGIERRARWSAANVKDAREAMTTLAERLRELGRMELADAVLRHRDLLGAQVRIRIVVAGEFKAGKTALVNALVGATVVPDDPLVPTTVPIEVSYGPEQRYGVLLGDGTLQEVSVEQARELAVSSDPERMAAVGRLAVEVPSPFLQPGITLVDTPNVSSGLASPSAGAVLALLHGADALLLAADAGRELDQAAVELIETARDLAEPLVVCALTKVDLHVHWDRVAEVNRRRLDELDIGGPVLPVSAALHGESCLTGDPDLLRESGMKQLRWYLVNTLMAEVLQRQSSAGLQAVVALLDEAAASVDSEALAAGNPVALQEIERQLADRQRQIDRLSSGLQGQLQHQLGLFANDVGAYLDKQLSDLSDLARDAIERSDPARSWPALQARIFEAGNGLVATHLAYLDRRSMDVAEAVSSYLAVEMAQLRLDRGPDLRSAVTGITSRPDVADLRAFRSRGHTSYDLVRGTLSGLLTTTGTVGTLGTLAQAVGLISLSSLAVPFAAVTLPLGLAGTAWTVKSLLARRREGDLESSRRAALEEVNRYVKTLGQQLRDDSRRAQWSLRSWLTETLQNAGPMLQAELAEELRRLAALRSAAASERATVVASRESTLSDLSIHLTRVRNLLYTLARPEMAPVQR